MSIYYVYNVNAKLCWHVQWITLIYFIYYIDILIKNPNFGSFLIFLNLNNNKIKLHMAIYRPLDLYILMVLN